jgi:hypothetical protein
MSGVANSNLCSTLLYLGTVFLRTTKHSLHATKAYMHGDTRMHGDPMAAYLPCWSNLCQARLYSLVSVQKAINTTQLIYLDTASGRRRESGHENPHRQVAHPPPHAERRAQKLLSYHCVDPFHDVTAFSFHPLLAPHMSLHAPSTDPRRSKPTMFGPTCHSVRRAKQSLQNCTAVEHAKTCRRSLRMIRSHVRRCLSQCGGTKLEGTTCAVRNLIAQAISRSFRFMLFTLLLCNAQLHNRCRAPARAEKFPKSSSESFPLDDPRPHAP